MKTFLISLLCLTVGVSFSYAAKGGEAGASDQAYEHASDQAIFNRVGNWFSDKGKDAAKETEKVEEKAARGQEKALKAQEKAAKEQEKALEKQKRIEEKERVRLEKEAQEKARQIKEKKDAATKDLGTSLGVTTGGKGKGKGKK